MKKTTAIVAFLSVGLLLGGTAVHGAEAATPALPTTQEGLIKELIKSIDGLTQVLSGIQDEKGVAAAKAKLEPIMGHQLRISEAMNKMPDPTPEEEAKLEKNYTATLEASMKKLATEYQRLGKVKGFKEAMAEIQAKLKK